MDSAREWSAALSSYARMEVEDQMEMAKIRLGAANTEDRTFRIKWAIDGKCIDCGESKADEQH